MERILQRHVSSQNSKNPTSSEGINFMHEQIFGEKLLCARKGLGYGEKHMVYAREELLAE